MANYPIASTTVFKNRSFDDLLRPLAMYTEELRKVEDASNELATKASIWEGMTDQETDPIAYAQYKRYADDLQNQAINLSQNGLNPASRRDLMNLKRRYATEIVPIEQAYKAVEDERKRRRESNDRSLLYATDNIRIDDYLGGKTPNLYNISGNELYTKGAATGKAYSSRIYSSGDGGSTLGGYYRDYVTRLGYNPDKLNTFQREMLMNGFASQVSALPELQEAANQILEANGVNQNLTGDNLVRAQQQVIRGIVDGAVYSEDHKPVRDAGRMSAAEAASNARAREGQALTAALHGMKPDGKGGYVWDAEIDPNFQKAAKVAEIKAQNRGGNGKNSAGYDDRNKQAIAVGSNGSVKIADSDGKLFGINISDLPVQTVFWTDIINKDGSIKDKNLASALKNSSIYGYEVYKIPKGTELDGSGWLWDDSTDEDYYILLPRDSKKEDNSSNTPVNTNWSNDIPEYE